MVFSRGLAILLVSAFTAAAAVPELTLSQFAYPRVLPGQQIVLEIGVINPLPDAVVAYEFVVGADQDEFFQVLCQTLHAPVDQPLYFGAFPVAVASSGGADLGAYDEYFTEGFATGTSLAQSLVIGISPETLPGTYFLNLSWTLPVLGGPSLLMASGVEFQMNSPLIVQIAVVPEPRIDALVLLAAGIGGVFGMTGLQRGRKNSQGQPLVAG